MRVGSLVRLNISCLGNPIGTIGIVYETYRIGLCNGVSVIFKNGNYDGFSEKEQSKFLKETGTYFPLINYKFTNVITLSQHFHSGIFTEAFKENDYENETSSTEL